MNVYDSDRIADVLGTHDFVLADDPGEADLAVLNTCHIREKAAEKVYSDLGRLKAIKTARASRGAPMMLAVSGCVAQAEGEEIARRQPAVDLVVGPQAYHRLPQMLEAAARTGERQIETAFLAEDKFAAVGQLPRRGSPTAFVTIQEGCDKFCTFCVVPYTRGAEYSRPAAAVVAEVEDLARAGVREVTLLGQNVNAYHGAGAPGEGAWSLARLLYRLAEIDGIARLRYTTSHPRDMSADLIAAHGALETLMPYLHLPVQAGSDKVLDAMNRQHTADDYLRLVERIRAARPDIALSTDLIVGFPGETDRDFEATMDLVREVTFAQAFSFKYSARPGTPASEAGDQVPEAVKTARLHALQEVLGTQQNRFNAACVGKTVPVLFDRAGRHRRQVIGRSPYLQAVHVTGPADWIGSVLDVRIDRAEANSLGGRVVAPRALPTSREGATTAA